VIIEPNTGTSNTLPGPVRSIVCQAGQIIVLDRTVNPPAATVLNADESFDGEGKAGLTIYDVDGSRIYWESTNEAENRTSSQLVVAPDARAEQATDLHGEPLEPSEVRGDNDPTDDHETGSFESRSKASLYALAKERNLDVNSKTSKEDLIIALRGE
jgi:hypothetical protein